MVVILLKLLEKLVAHRKRTTNRTFSEETYFSMSRLSLDLYYTKTYILISIRNIYEIILIKLHYTQLINVIIMLCCTLICNY